MSTGVIKQAKEDELVTLGDRQFMRWIVQVELPDGTTTQSSVLRRPDSPDPTGLPCEEKPKGGWKVSQQQDGAQRGSGGGSGQYKADPDKLANERRKLVEESKRSALFAAVKTAPEGTSSADILKVASVYYEWIVGPV